MVVSSRLTQDYVVFTRTTSTIWESMPDASKLSNTLYFVVDGADDDIGQLYLGKTLIADGSGISSMALQSLSDVNLSVETLADASILAYNAEDEKWEADTLVNQIGNLIDVFDGSKVGLVPVPTNGPSGLFLQDNGIWANPTEEVSSDLSALQAVVETIIGSDTGSSMREIAQEEATAALQAVVANAPEAFDTLKEIADWIIENPGVGDLAILQAQVDNLDKIINGFTDTESGEEHEGLVAVVSDLQEQLETAQSDIEALEDWKENTAGPQFTSISSSLDALLAKDLEHDNKIAALEEKLKWQELYATEE